ncbi:carbohydrate ABC transporter permease [Paenibacillus nasutitermitis]|uniref:ABC transporter permease n=1 Tax=Paenibacillus nasutitermitis TaxID=1652958 RepID=A0A917DQU9_9BACL|nr:sugar ABC transporter permease [Paenibacillus nasutitermitis]GGD62234.1 ABC transporter permease [Paenibacillus nasutitermitis]
MHIRKMYPLWLLLPVLLIYGSLYIFPTLSGFYYSVTDWNIYKESIQFVGIQQYKDLFAAGDLMNAMKHTVIYAVIVTIMQNGLGLGLALVLTSRIAGRNWFRTIFFLPCVLSTLIIGYVFSAIYQPEGILNEFLRFLGLDFMTTDWLGNADVALYSISAANIWQYSGFTMAIYIAGILMIPKELTEASIIDGSSYFKRVRHVIFPLLAPSFTINVILSLIGSLKVFDTVFALTSGGPGDATEVVNTYIFDQFSDGMYAYGTAANVCLFIVIAVISFAALSVLRKREVQL